MTARPLLNEDRSLMLDEEGMFSFVLEDGCTMVKVKANEIDLSKESLILNVGDRQITLVLPQKSPVAKNAATEQFEWDDSSTKLFFEKYSSNKGKKKSVIHKRLFETIASEMQGYGYSLNAQQVANKYKSLERAFKAHVAGNKTGRGRQTLNYETEMMELFSKKHNITPKVVSGRHGLTIRSNSVDIPENSEMLDTVDPGPSTSEASRQRAEISSPQPSADIPSQLSTTNISKRDGKTAMALKAVREEIALQNHLLMVQAERDAEIIKELKRGNQAKEEANALRAQRNEILSNLLKELQSQKPE